MGEDPQDSTQAKHMTHLAVGDYTLIRNLGVGSSGKVKLARHNTIGKEFAIKVISRAQYGMTPPCNAGGPRPYKKNTKDLSAEARVLREASITKLLHHPNICSLHEIFIHSNQYFLVFEYVNGVQMLDYIISRGKVKERTARKFARQIGSALEYCHRNNVVHRNLCLENILVSETTDITIIDFGLSNLFDLSACLDTYCATHYFPAPEILDGVPYTGPKVDVWSFGVVLYTIVCGRVPFDAENLPLLHAKIKQGLLKYPVWITKECKHLLSRMLVTNSSTRASLSEVLCHPWMVRGFSGPPDPHLGPREPLRSPEVLDRGVINNMKGFDFGTQEEIERRLTGILESESYLSVVERWEDKNRTLSDDFDGVGGIDTFSPSRASLAVSDDATVVAEDETNENKRLSDSANPGRSRFSILRSFPLKFLSPVVQPPAEPCIPSSCRLDVEREQADPTGGFHPLLSVYYLTREILERERAARLSK
ncbi:hypothetical protein JAAARDRAFT_42203 [Jaapia argillacea MUCL 33604]|uniref:Protein kinase domain-containing protein n=1 Tax=Jaapia argillacea MUCL 33604 TaxID=933084 RepID=A0A067PH33_9AGAM|nr:hypothetical protein JAAARDRAFT_42203 [Jaapia argillacea MUCL 33604]